MGKGGARTFRGLIAWKKAHQSKDLGYYIDTTQLMYQLEEVSKLLHAYSKSLTPKLA